MTNLGESLPKEILRTNRSGAYHCTTLVDCNTRKYHVLLVIPVPKLDDENHVLPVSYTHLVTEKQCTHVTFIVTICTAILKQTVTKTLTDTDA